MRVVLHVLPYGKRSGARNTQRRAIVTPSTVPMRARQDALARLHPPLQRRHTTFVPLDLHKYFIETLARSLGLRKNHVGPLDLL